MQSEYKNIGEVLREFFEHGKIIGNTLLGTVSNDNARLFQIELDSRDINESESWMEGFLVTIIHKHNGKVADHFFSFKDYLGDTIRLIHSSRNSKNCLEWYRSTPTDLNKVKMTGDIYKWIDCWV